MPKLRVDGQEVEVEPGATVLEAAAKVGIEIPTLCHCDGGNPEPSCMVCAVKNRQTGQWLPACAARAADGMDLECESDEVFETRRTAVELLLSDHLGDCLAPCHRVCPLGMNIPVMLRQIRAGRLDQAIATVRDDIPFPALVSRLCHRPCESGCRRRGHDGPVAIRCLVQYVADGRDLRSGDPYRPHRKPGTGLKVAIVGAGAAGLSACWFLLREGHECTLLDAREELGGVLREAAVQGQIPLEILEAEIGLLRDMGAELWMGMRVGAGRVPDDLRREFDAVLIAAGADGANVAEGFGAQLTKQGVAVMRGTHETSAEGVFAAGHVVRKKGKFIHTVASGKAAATSVHQFLSGQPVRGPHKPFSSSIGKLKEGEIEQFLTEASPEGSAILSDESDANLHQEEAAREASRCLRCDCRATSDCKLLQAAERYGARQNRFPADRKRFGKTTQHALVVYEPGKCIRCGNCVAVAQRSREPLGLTFIGRGFDVRVEVPFGERLSDGLREAAEASASVCPTGALVPKRDQG